MIILSKLLYKRIFLILKLLNNLKHLMDNVLWFKCLIWDNWFHLNSYSYFHFIPIGVEAIIYLTVI